MSITTLQRTPLYDVMLKEGGKMVDFFGWELPVQFKGVIAEHKAVRTDCGMFDVSHMGQVFVTGKDAHNFVQKVNSNNIKAMPGKGSYSHVLHPHGGLVDDVIAFCLSADRFYIVINAATIDKDVAWFKKNAEGMDVKIDNASPRFAMIAIQGPRAPEIFKTICPKSAEMPRFGIIETEVLGKYAVVTRTGYTGEDGFEIAMEGDNIVLLWNEFINKGVMPCGLGSRDVLRLEAGYLLYGQDVDDNHTSFQANYGWVVKFNKGEFNGKDALLKEQKEGIKTKLTGFALKEKGVARHGNAIYKNGAKIGELTSATFSPVLNKSIGLGYVPPDMKTGDEAEIEIHGRKFKAEVCPSPFYDNKV